MAAGFRSAAQRWLGWSAKDVVAKKVLERLLSPKGRVGSYPMPGCQPIAA